MTLLTAVVERGLRHYLALDPQTLEQLAEFTDKVIAIEFTGWNKKLYLFPEGQQGLRLQNYYEGSVDAGIKGSPVTLMRVGLIGSERLNGLADIEMTGDVILIQRFMQVFQQMQIDWEELLSFVAGDIVAHQMGTVWRGFKQWAGGSLSNLTHQLTEYLQEEARYLPPEEEVEDFFAQIQKVQNDVARLELRMKAL